MGKITVVSSIRYTSMFLSYFLEVIILENSLRHHDVGGGENVTLN